MDPMPVFAAGATVGALFGWFAASNRRSIYDRPMRLVSTFAYAPPGLPAKSAPELGQWELYTVSFAFHGGLVGFSYRAMRDHGICRRAAWEQYTDLLKGAGVLAATERSATSWAGGWSYSRLRMGIKSRRLALPYPAGSPPALNSPKIAAQMAQHSAAGTGKLGVAL